MGKDKHFLLYAEKVEAIVKKYDDDHAALQKAEGYKEGYAKGIKESPDGAGWAFMATFICMGLLSVIMWIIGQQMGKMSCI